MTSLDTTPPQPRSSTLPSPWQPLALPLTLRARHRHKRWTKVRARGSWAGGWGGEGGRAGRRGQLGSTAWMGPLRGAGPPWWVAHPAPALPATQAVAARKRPDLECHQGALLPEMWRPLRETNPDSEHPTGPSHSMERKAGEPGSGPRPPRHPRGAEPSSGVTGSQ